MMKSIRKIILMELLLIFICLICSSCAGMQSYTSRLDVQSYIGFDFDADLELIFKGDAYEKSGREHDTLWVFTYRDHDGSFENFVVDSDWQCLPLTNDVLSLDLLSVDFCPVYMSMMISSVDGYYQYHDENGLHYAYVYDTKNNLLFVRRATYFSRETWPISTDDIER